MLYSRLGSLGRCDFVDVWRKFGTLKYRLSLFLPVYLERGRLA
jgi:hypothetical protein